MKLSICIPTMNRARDLEKLLSSIAGEILEYGVEVVVSNNNSTDDTSMVLKDSKIVTRYITTDRDLSFNENVSSVLSLATGDYCWFMGDHDTIANGAICKILKTIQKVDVGVCLLNYWIKGNMAIDIYEDLYFKSGQDYVNYAADKFSHNDWDAAKLTFLSSLIVNRKMYLSQPKNTGICPHAYVALGIIKSAGVYIISRPYLSQSNEGHGNANYSRLWAEIYWHIGLVYEKKLWAIKIIARMLASTAWWNMYKMTLAYTTIKR